MASLLEIAIVTFVACFCDMEEIISNFLMVDIMEAKVTILTYHSHENKSNLLIVTFLGPGPTGRDNFRRY